MTCVYVHDMTPIVLAASVFGRDKTFKGLVVLCCCI